jgi:HK97 family phage portal protein
VGLLSRIFRPSAAPAAGGSLVTKAAGDAGYQLLGGWLPAAWGSAWNFWQLGYDPIPSTTTAVVQACVSSYAQTIAMCPGAHWRKTAKGGRERVTNSALSRVLKKPNSYQTISDFMLNATRQLYTEGNAYALILRNNRFEVDTLHLFDPRSCAARIAITGDVFYNLGGNEIVERMFASAGATSALAYVPARDVLHLRLDTPQHPLQGEPPLTSALMEISASNAVIRQALAYTANQGRPSGVIETDLQLNSDQVQELRRRWNEQTQGVSAGGTPILTSGLKWNSIAVNSKDAQLAEMLQISDQRIATVYRVPLAILSLGKAEGPQGSTESLMQFWLATGFGFCVNHVEQGLERLFGLGGWPDEYVEFDTSALLRSNFKDRIEGLASGVKGGIYAINDARAVEELPAVEGGDEPRVQQQDVPLSAWGMAPPATPAPPAGPPADPAPPAPNEPEEERANAESVIRAFRISRERNLAA